MFSVFVMPQISTCTRFFAKGCGIISESWYSHHIQTHAATETGATAIANFYSLPFKDGKPLLESEEKSNIIRFHYSLALTQ